MWLEYFFESVSLAVFHHDHATASETDFGQNVEHFQIVEIGVDAHTLATHAFALVDEHEQKRRGKSLPGATVVDAQAVHHRVAAVGGIAVGEPFSVPNMVVARVASGDKGTIAHHLSAIKQHPALPYFDVGSHGVGVGVAILPLVAPGTPHHLNLPFQNFPNHGNVVLGGTANVKLVVIPRRHLLRLEC